VYTLSESKNDQLGQIVEMVRQTGSHYNAVLLVCLDVNGAIKHEPWIPGHGANI
jgi:hypothetical protein